MGIVDDLERARAAFERRDWATAYDRLSSDRRPRARGDLLTLATAAYLVGDNDACIRALQRGYRRQVDDGDILGAVRFAFWLALVLNTRGEVAIGSGWAARAERLLADQPGDVVERGYLLDPRLLPPPRPGRLPRCACASAPRSPRSAAGSAIPICSPRAWSARAGC